MPLHEFLVCPKPFAGIEEHCGGGLSWVYDYEDNY
jgi:hypothetical protein